MKMPRRTVKRLCVCLTALVLGSVSVTSNVKAEEFTSVAGRFRVDMGDEPEKTIHVAPRNALQFHFSTNSDEGRFLVTYDDYPQESKVKPNSAERFVELSKNGYATGLGATDLQVEVVTQAGHSGSELKFTSATSGLQFRVRLFFANERGYSLLVFGSKEFINGQKATAFLDSFEPLKESGDVFDVLRDSRNASEEFVLLSDKGANFQALTLPGVRFISGKISKDSDEQLNVFAARGKKGIYGIVYQDVSDLDGNDSRRLAEVTRNALNAISGGNATKFNQTASKKVKQSGMEATQFDFEHERGIDQIRLRVFVADERVYSLGVGGLVNSFAAARPDEFLDAFRLLKSKPVERKDTPTPPPSTNNPDPEPSQTKKPSNSEKTTREETIRQLKDI